MHSSYQPTALFDATFITEQSNVFTTSDVMLLHTIVAGTYAKVGNEFFRALVSKLAAALDVRYTFITECIDHPTTRVRTLEFWMGSNFGANIEYGLAGTPCAAVIGGATCFHPASIQSLFPEDRDLVALSAESYIGVPLVSSAGVVIGHLAALDTQSLDQEERRRAIMQIFAARAAAELERRQVELALRESETRLRAQDDALRELSTPIFPVSDDVVMIPLIGAIDSRRAQQVIEQLLQGVMNQRARIAILDITGMPLVDTQAADTLIRAAQAVRLLGAQVLITGIRPEVAQTMVSLGINLEGILTRATLQSGIAHALQQR
jgi:anti-anti-sigma regulatory factor